MSQGIRLRVVIRRHAVPDVKLVWPCTEDLSIAKLLSEINEVVPLESGDWGLEDYAVELADGRGGSFECLHFQQVGRILKDDDQVLIRSLLTEDIRLRRVSGRHQITTDGRHLVDGIPFGKPRLRAPRDRPSFSLPPRKRARVTYDHDFEDDDEDDYNDDSDDETEDQLLLEAPEPGNTGVSAFFDDADLDGDDDDGEDSEAAFDTQNGEYSSSEDDADDEELEDEGLVNEELRLLQHDNALVGEGDDHSTEQRSGLEAIMSGLGMNLESLDHITALHQAFPLTPTTAIESELRRQGNNLRATYNVLATTNDPTLSFDDLMDRVVTGLLGSPVHESMPGLEASPFQGFSSPARPLIEEVESFDTVPNGGSGSTSATLNISASTKENVHMASEDDSSSSDSDSSSDSSSSEDSSDEDSDSAPRVVIDTGDGNQLILLNRKTDSDSSDSEDDSSDESSSEDDDRGANVSRPSGEATSDSSSDEDSSSSSDDSDSDSDSDSSGPELVSSKRPVQPLASTAPVINKPAPSDATVKSDSVPKQGLKRTQQRNARRREVKRHKMMQAQAAAAGGDLEARRQALLSAVAMDETEDLQEESVPGDADTTANADVLQETAHSTTAADTAAAQAEAPSEPGHVEALEKDVADMARPEGNAVDEHQKPVQETPEGTSASPKDGSSQRRRRMDLGAGRRLLFGALGLKTPKTKADEEKIKQGLMKDVKPLNNPRTDEPAAKEPTEVDQEPDDPDFWKDKIIYRAVECCHEGMVLSEPPFPFVQRWDPQQQYGSMKKRKRSSQNFYDESYYDESYYDESYYDGNYDGNYDENYYGDASQVQEGAGKKKKKKSKKQQSRAATPPAEPADDVVLNYDDATAEDRNNAHTGKADGGSQFTDADDLPSLPSDLSILPALEPGASRPGMVVTWKQLLMSKATGWQPQIASVTALVMVGSDENTLRVLLAKRDREQDERVYDEGTGKRIYDKFEAPDSDEEGQEDDGYRDVPWGEMLEPRVLQQAPSGLDLTGGVNANLASDMAQSEIQHAGPSAEEPMQGVSKGNEESSGSISIQSGQKMPHLELSTPEVGLSPDKSNGHATEPSANADAPQSPAHQLQETSQALVTDPQQPPPNAQESEDLDVDFGLPDMSNGGMELDDKNSPALEYPALTVPSSIGSPHSGRQPLSHYSDSQDQVDESVIPETVLPAHTVTSAFEDGQPADESPNSSSPFPSLEEIFHTAATSRQTQSPSKAKMSTTPSIKSKGDMEYEEAMRRLDEGDESDGSPNKNRSIRSLFPNATQPSPSLDTGVVSSDGQTPTKSRPKRKTRSQRSPFVVPEGSQVISLDSSPSANNVVEDYAKDSVDETYGEKLLPKGPGWVKKTRASQSKAKRGKGKSAPVTERKSSLR